LKEFSDFETHVTPKFRHPPIRGNKNQLNEIGIFLELYKCRIYYTVMGNESSFDPKEIINFEVNRS